MTSAPWPPGARSSALTRRARPNYRADVDAPCAPVATGLTFGPFGMVVPNAPTGFVQEHSAECSAEAHPAMMPHRARVLRAGQLIEISDMLGLPGDDRVVVTGPDKKVRVHCALYQDAEETSP